MSDQETETVACVVTGETQKAFRLRDQDNPELEDYFPKSQVSFKRRNIKTGVAIAEIPLWLLNEKGWNS